MSEYLTRSEKKGVFVPKWDRLTLLFIADQLNEMVDVIDVQYALCKQYHITTVTAARWIETARRIMKDVSNGLTWQEAMDRDQERRNVLRRRAK